LLDEVDPLLIFEKQMEVPPDSHSYYLLEFHLSGPNWWDQHVWYFENLEQFKRFLPALIFRDLIIELSNSNYNENLDLSKEYKEYLEVKEIPIEEKAFVNFVHQYNSDKLELVEFGRVQDLLDLSQSEFEYCKKIRD